MKTGREFLNEHIEETNIPAEHWEIEIGEMMEWYADYYHQTKLKLLGIGDVRQQSELLNAFLEWRLTKPHSDFQTREYDINEFLKAFNCA